MLGEREAIARVTASVCRDLRVDLYSSGGMMPPTVYGATAERNLSWRVFFLSRGPEGATTRGGDMLDKTKFFPLSMASSFCVRGMLHPLTVVKTRLQVSVALVYYTRCLKKTKHI